MKRANDEPDKENIPPKPKKLIILKNSAQNVLSIPSTTNNPSQTISSSSCSSANSSDKCQELSSFDEDNTLNSQCSQNTQTQEPKQISAGLVNELISRSKLQPEPSQVFMDIVYIVEMFNKVVYSMNHRDNSLSKIDFVRLFRSIRSNDENVELSKLLRMLFGILIKTLRHTDIQLFNLPLNRIDLEDISAINLARSLMKSMRAPIKKLIFREYSFEDELKRTETLGHLSLHVKIKLCFRLVEYLGFEMNDTKSRVKEYLLKEKEFEDELEKLKAKIDILSAITYNRGQKDLYLKLKEERRSLEVQLNQLQSDLNEMKGTRSLISLELDDSSGDFISLWQFDCLPGCLMLERFKPIELREEISFTQSQSNWYLVSDSECLSKLFETLKTNRLMSCMTEWRVEKDIKDNQDYLNEVSFEITAPISTNNQLIDDEKSKIILNKLIDIRDRIVANRKIAYEMEFNQTDKSFSSFKYDTEHNEMFDLALNGPNDQMIEKLKFLLECAYMLIDKTCLGKLYWNNWKREVEEIRTLSELELMMYLFESNISWDNEPVCLMCLTRGELDQREEISLADGPVVQCANCEIAYHLRCITDCEEKQEHNLFNLRAQILCSECYMIKLSNDEISRRARI